MDRSFVLALGLTGWLACSVFAQSSDPAPLKPGARHKLTEKQISEIRQPQRTRRFGPGGHTPFSMPGSVRGQSIQTSEALTELLGKMSRRDRRAILNSSKTASTDNSFDGALAVAKNLVLYELHVTETDPTQPLIDVDGDGELDRVDALRYSGSEFPNDRLCGPTIVFHRNQKLVINLRNMLDKRREPVLEWNDGSEPPSPPDPPAYWMMDAPHELFSTNLHMHGLHVSPGSRHDNSFLDLPPSSDGTPNDLFLDYRLPRDHVAGTFWYHAHRHGSVAYQLANGMAGALIVLGDPSPNSSDLESLPEIQAANQIRHPTDSSLDIDYGRVLLLQQLVFTKTDDGASESRWIVDPADINDRKTAPSEQNSGRITAGIPEPKPESSEVLAVNGQNAPTIEIQRGQVERWRLIHAGRESALNLAWYDARSLKDANNAAPSVTTAIESYEIATDGIPTGRLTKLQNTELYPGYRVDLLVRVTAQAADGEYWLLPSEAQRLTKTQLGPLTNATPVARLIVRGEMATAMALPTNAQLSRFRRPPPDLTNAETLDVNFTFADELRFGVANTSHGPGKPYSETESVESIVITLDTPQIWNLGVREFLPGVPESIKHPFHIHVNPFYVPSLDCWKDTIAISREEITPVYFLPTDFAGRSMLHCHILDHEDQGMMKDIFIEGTRRWQYPDLYSLERVPSHERIRADGFQLVPNKNNVLLFITGLGCPHCAKGTIKLWKRSDPLDHFDAAIQCVSAGSFTPKNLADLGLNKKKDFSFQVAPAGFRLSKFEEAPEASGLGPAPKTPPMTHGVLIFDKQQRLRFRYLGDHPLQDLDDITYALMELEETEYSPKGKFHRVTARPRPLAN